MRRKLVSSAFMTLAAVLSAAAVAGCFCVPEGTPPEGNIVTAPSPGGPGGAERRYTASEMREYFETVLPAELPAYLPAGTALRVAAKDGAFDFLPRLAVASGFAAAGGEGEEKGGYLLAGEADAGSWRVVLRDASGRELRRLELPRGK